MNNNFTFLQNAIIGILDWFYFAIRNIIVLFHRDDKGYIMYCDLYLFRLYTRIKTFFIPWERLSEHTKMIETSCEDGCQLININLLCKDRQSVHPDVIPYNIYGANGWCMVISSYPYRCDYYETPILAKSFDGIDWVKIPVEIGFKSTDSESYMYHSDPSLMCFDDTIAFFDRVVRVGKDGSAEILIFLQLSRNLFQWTNPTMIMRQCSVTQNHAKLLSPTFLKLREHFFCWYAEKAEWSEQLKLYRIESDDLYSWKNKLEVIIDEINNGGIWHLDIIEYEGILLMAGDVRNGKSHQIQLFISDDYGITWKNKMILANPEMGFSGRSVYRASMTIINEKMYLYYTGRSELDRWQAAVKIIPMEVVW